MCWGKLCKLHVSTYRFFGGESSAEAGASEQGGDSGLRHWLGVYAHKFILLARHRLCIIPIILLINMALAYSLP